MTFEVRTFEARTVSWWYRSRSEIDFDPSYQRRGQVWDSARQSFLIDTVLNDFDMPKLYLADFTYFKSPLNSSGARFAVIDGKQRLNALFAFLDDQVALAGDFVLREDPDQAVAGLTYSQLRATEPSLAAKIENYNLPVMSVITDELGAVQELFVRLNSGKPLTPAERRNAMPGEIPELVREIVSSTFFSDCVAFSARGGAHEQAAAKLLLLELSESPVDLKRAQLDQLYSAGEKAYGRDRIELGATSVLETLVPMAESFDSRDSLLRTQGQLPVYYLLFREIGMPQGVRDKILEFHRLRLSVRRQDQGSLAEPFLEKRLVNVLSEYDRMMRNPNDAKSVYHMTELLRSYILLA